MTIKGVFSHPQSFTQPESINFLSEVRMIAGKIVLSLKGNKKETRNDKLRWLLFRTFACTWQKTRPLQVITFFKNRQFLLCAQCAYSFSIGQFLPAFIAD